MNRNNGTMLARFLIVFTFLATLTVLSMLHSYSFIFRNRILLLDARIDVHLPLSTFSNDVNKRVNQSIKNIWFGFGDRHTEKLDGKKKAITFTHASIFFCFRAIFLFYYCYHIRKMKQREESGQIMRFSVISAQQIDWKRTSQCSKHNECLQLCSICVPFFVNRKKYRFISYLLFLILPLEGLYLGHIHFSHLFLLMCPFERVSVSDLSQFLLFVHQTKRKKK